MLIHQEDASAYLKYGRKLSTRNEGLEFKGSLLINISEIKRVIFAKTNHGWGQRCQDPIIEKLHGKYIFKELLKTDLEKLV